MKREFRYMVVKYKDMVVYLSESEQMELIELVKKVDAGRREVGKPQLECVCVEADWPEYEAVWSMIAARVDGGERKVASETLSMLFDRLENEYNFECIAGPLKNCVDWIKLRAELAQRAQAQPDGEVVAGTGCLNDLAVIKWCSDYRPKIGDKIYAAPVVQRAQAEPVAWIVTASETIPYPHIERLVDVSSFPAGTKLYAQPMSDHDRLAQCETVRIPTSENEAKLMVLLGMQYLGLDKVDSLPIAAAPESWGPEKQDAPGGKIYRGATLPPQPGSEEQA